MLLLMLFRTAALRIITVFPAGILRGLKKRFADTGKII